MKTLAERLTWARNERGFSQQQLANEAGIAQSTIGSLEAGTRLSARKITQIAAALEVSSDWLADGKGEPKQARQAPVPAAPSKRRLQWVEDDEAELLSQFRALGQAEKATSLVVLRSLPKAVIDDRPDQGQA